jgi:hypothetical protein
MISRELGYRTRTNDQSDPEAGSPHLGRWRRGALLCLDLSDVVSWRSSRIDAGPGGCLAGRRASAAGSGRAKSFGDLVVEAAIRAGMSR